MNYPTVSDIKLSFKKGNYNIIDCEVRTGKTYWAVNNLKQFSRDGMLNRILFLVDTNALKDNILAEYSDFCCNADEWWQFRSSWGEQENKIGVMCYQAFGAKVMKDDIPFLSEIDCICWDECDSIFDFAAQAFAKARKTDFARANLSNEEVLAGIQHFSTKKEYMPLVLLSEWEKIVREGKILCIGLSATPERAKVYYESIVHCANQGRLENAYHALETVYFTDLAEHIKTLPILSDKGYWCYSEFIRVNQKIVELANNLGFSAIELHSANNKDFPLNEEQKLAVDIIETSGMVPLKYNFVVVNKAFARGFNLHDKRFNQLIVNSTDLVDREQARRQTFEIRCQHFKTLFPSIPLEYLNRWLSAKECRELADLINLPDLEQLKNKQNSRQMSWNKLKDYLPSIGYTVEKKRKMLDGKQQIAYFITGEWKEKKQINDSFMELVCATGAAS